MNAVVEAVNGPAALWWPYVLHATWTGSLVAACLLFAVRLGRRWPAQLRYGIILIALLKFAVPPMCEMPTGLFSRFGPAVSLHADQPIPTDNAGVSVVGRSTAQQGSGQLKPLSAVSWQGWLLMGHALGCLIVAGYVASRIMMLTAISRRARWVRSGPLHDQFIGIYARLGLRRPVRLLVTSQATPPMAFGTWRPRVLLPDSAVRELSADQMTTVLAHELAHHRRGDLWVSWLQAGLAVVWWFNPMVRMLNRALARASEDCCDDLLLCEQFTTGHSYCQVLVKVAGGLRTAVSDTVTGLTRYLHPLAGRIRRIMDGRPRRLPRWSLATLAPVVILAGLLLPGLPTEQSPEPVSRQMIAERTAPAGELAAPAAPTAWAALELEPLWQTDMLGSIDRTEASTVHVDLLGNWHGKWTYNEPVTAASTTTVRTRQHRPIVWPPASPSRLLSGPLLARNYRPTVLSSPVLFGISDITTHRGAPSVTYVAAVPVLPVPRVGPVPDLSVPEVPGVESELDRSPGRQLPQGQFADNLPASSPKPMRKPSKSGGPGRSPTRIVRSDLDRQETLQQSQPILADGTPRESRWENRARQEQRRHIRVLKRWRALSQAEDRVEQQPVPQQADDMQAIAGITEGRMPFLDRLLQGVLAPGFREEDVSVPLSISQVSAAHLPAVDITAVPEPATMVLLLAAGPMLLIRRRRRRMTASPG